MKAGNLILKRIEGNKASILDIDGDIKCVYVPVHISAADGREFEIIEIDKNAFPRFNSGNRLNCLQFDPLSAIESVNYSVLCKFSHVMELPQNLKRIVFDTGSYLGSPKNRPVIETCNKYLISQRNGSIMFLHPSEIVRGEFKRSRLIIRETTQSIGKFAFKGNLFLNSVFFPASLTKIEEFSFSECINLKYVTFAADSLLKSIKKEAFSQTGIKRITFPASLVHIEDGAFAKCKNLKKVVFLENSKIKSIGADAFIQTALKKLNVPCSCEEIKRCAFYECSDLEFISFEKESKLKIIDSWAFRSTAVKELHFPVSIEEIRDCAFYECQNLRFISFGSDSKLKKIQMWAFRSTSLKAIVIPSNVEEIGESVFSDCRKLKSISFTNDVIPYKFQNVIRVPPSIIYGCQKLSIPNLVSC